MAILTFIFLLSIPYAAFSTNFSFTNLTSNSQDLILTGGPSNSAGEPPSSPKYQRGTLTPTNSSDPNTLPFRIIYTKPLHLWNKTSRGLASFSTNFSFMTIDSNQSANSLTFFLAQNYSEINIGPAAMGLPFNTTSNVSINPFVAVQFDKYNVSIKINSLKPVQYLPPTNAGHGQQHRACIAYDGRLKNLSVSVFTGGFQTSKVVSVDRRRLSYNVDLRLSYNVDLREVLPEWVIFGFTAGSSFEEHNLQFWMFKSSDPSPVVLHESPNISGILVGLTVGLGVVALITFLAIFAFVLSRRRKKKYEFEEEESGVAVEMNNEFEMGASGPRRFAYHELVRSTDGFVEKEKLGEGGFGGVYKGFLKDYNTYVAVKRVSKTSRQGIKEYASEVRVISRLRHRNLVQLIGWCHEKGELLLVYEYMENGSLDFHLFMEKSLLTWGTRYKIATGLASAVFYLHEEWEQCVLHRDIKSSNVMLDSNFNAKLGDFGLAKLVDHEKGSQTTILAGTLGYMAPECLVTGKASKESDVFSFGVVALEIACGRKPIVHKAEEKQIRLIDWVWDLYGSGTLLEAVDPRLELDFEDEEIKRLMMVGLWCVHPDSELRPTMRQVLQVLKYEATLPVLPSKMLVASYQTSSSVSSADFSRPWPSTSTSFLTTQSVSKDDLARSSTSTDSSLLHGR